MLPFIVHHYHRQHPSCVVLHYLPAFPTLDWAKRVSSFSPTCIPTKQKTTNPSIHPSIFPPPPFTLNSALANSVCACYFGKAPDCGTVQKNHVLGRGYIFKTVYYAKSVFGI